MAWTIEWIEAARKDLQGLDRPIQQRIVRYLLERIETDEDPKRFGRPLSGDLSGFWRYRVGDYRIICSIESERLVVLVVGVGHRRNVYS